MIKGICSLFGSIIISALAVNLPAQTGEQRYLKLYDESIFIISNYSGISSSTPEVSAFSALLNNKVDGFRFIVTWDSNSKQFVIKNPDASFTPLFNTLVSVRHALEADSAKILTLFLDFGLDAAELADVFQQAGLNQYLHTHDAGTNWPSLQSMIRSNRRLVVFGMLEHENSPAWLHFIWNYALEPSYTASGEISYSGESFPGNPHKSLLLFNGFSSSLITSMQGTMEDYISQNPELIELFKSTWISTGKTPNFIMLDRYDAGIASLVDRLRGFNTIRGTVTFNGALLNYINWEGLNNLTSGKFSFPITPGEEFTLSPRCPGYKITPGSITITGSETNETLHFTATLLKITDDLEACYQFNGNARDLSGNKHHGQIRNIEFINDPIRGVVASFAENSLIGLVKAEILNIRDHDFTVAVWLKISKYLPEKADYCILSSGTPSYQRGLHYLVRNKQPYMGFFNDDLAGNKTIEEGQWYHIVWRYNKLSKEQAIFVDGRLDARSRRRPSFKGTDSLYIGAYYYPKANMAGEIDDLCIWSRALGEEDILGLSNQTIGIAPELNILMRFPLITLVFIVVLVLSALYLISRKIRFKSKPGISSPKQVTDLQHAQVEKTFKNYVKLFGDFRVFDKEGQDMTYRFTPKIKQLFLAIIIHSQGDHNGILTRDLSEMLWKNQSPENAKNIRGVTIRKLRLILEALDKVDIVFQADKWSVRFSGLASCDYLECLKLLREEHHQDNNFFRRFFEIIKEGAIFQGESHDWLDDSKGYIENRIVDILLGFLAGLSLDTDSEMILKLTDQVLVNDPANETALSFKIKALIKQHNNNLARYTFARFCSLYEEMYGEKYTKTFDQLTE